MNEIRAWNRLSKWKKTYHRINNLRLRLKEQQTEGYECCAPQIGDKNEGLQIAVNELDHLLQQMEELHNEKRKTIL